MQRILFASDIKKGTTVRPIKIIGIFSAGLIVGLVIQWTPSNTVDGAEGEMPNLGPNCPADIAPAPLGDGIVNVNDLLAVINAWGLCPRDDVDNDGWTVQDGDCDDNNPNVYPGAPEVCNNVDDDCDKAIDEGFIDGHEPNDLCAQASYFGNISGDACGGLTLFTVGTLMPPGDVDFLRFLGTEDVLFGSIDLFATVTLSVPASASSSLHMCARCPSCSSQAACINVMPGQSGTLRVHWEDVPGETNKEIILEIRQNAPATGVCELYQVTVSCASGPSTITCD